MNVSNLLLLLHEITKLFLIFCTFSSHHDDANAVACYYYLRLDISMLMRSTLLTFSMLLVLVLNPRALDIVVPRLRYFSTRKIYSKRQLGSHVACYYNFWFRTKFLPFQSSCLRLTLCITLSQHSATAIRTRLLHD
jgi:hypothetical protein